MKYILFILFLTTSFSVTAQSPYARVDSIMRSYNKNVKNTDDLREVWYFIYQNFSVDSLRLRACVVWIAENIAYDVKAWQSENPEAGQIDYALRRKKAVCAGYASLLKYLCDMFRIECEVVSGRVRAFERDIYISQSKLSDNHAWNMVKVNDQWRLVDPTWIAGSVSGEMDDSKAKFVKEFNELYYFTPPERLILNHFPRQSRHQLLSPAVKEADFKTSPLFFSSFLSSNVTSMFPTEALIKAVVGDTLTFKFTANYLPTEILAWSPTQKNAEFKAETSSVDNVIEFKYPVTVSGYYNLLLGPMIGMRGQAAVAYKLQVDANRNTK